MGKKPTHKHESEQVAAAQAEAVAETDLPLSFSSPESSTIQGASYDPRTETLQVEFATAAYQYGRFPYQGSDPSWQGFLDAESKGGYFSRFIRPMFQARKL